MKALPCSVLGGCDHLIPKYCLFQLGTEFSNTALKTVLFQEVTMQNLITLSKQAFLAAFYSKDIWKVVKQFCHKMSHWKCPVIHFAPLSPWHFSFKVISKSLFYWLIDWFARIVCDIPTSQRQEQKAIYRQIHRKMNTVLQLREGVTEVVHATEDIHPQ